MSQSQFKKELGFWSATLMGVGALIGGGIFVLSGRVVNLLGTNAIYVYIIALLAALFTALSYAELATAYPKEGGGYTYVKEIIGGLPAFLTGWSIISGSVVACVLYALGFSEYFLSLFGDHLYQEALIPYVAIFISLTLILINIRSVKKTSTIENIITVAKMSILFVIISFAFTKVSIHNLTGFRINHSPSLIMNTISLIYISFFGFEVIASANEEIKDAKKTIPRAILASLLIATIIYLLIIGVMVGVFGSKTNLKDDLLLIELAKKAMGTVGLYLLIFAGIFSTLSAFNATILAASRQVYAMGRDHFLPEFLSRIHPKFKTPQLALLLIFVFVSVLSVNGSVESVAKISSFSFLFALSFTNLALIISRFKSPAIDRPFKLPWGTLIPSVGLLFNLTIIAFLDKEYLISGIIWLLIGTVIYFSLKKITRSWLFVLKMIGARVKNKLIKKQKR